MPLAWGAIIRLLLEGTVEWLKWKVLEAKYALKMALIDRKERYEDEAESKQKQIDDAHAAGRHDYADRLYDNLIGRTQFIVDLSASVSHAEEGNIDTNPQGPVPPPGG